MASGCPRPRSSRTSVARAIRRLRESRIPLLAMRSASVSLSNLTAWQFVGIRMIRLQRWESGPNFAAFYLHIPDMRIGCVTPVRIIVGMLQTEVHGDVQPRCLWEVSLPFLTNWQSIARLTNSQRLEFSPSSATACLDPFCERRSVVFD